MTIRLIIFLGIILLLLFGMHFAFFRSAIHFFAISRPGARRVLYMVMVLLTISFVAAFILVHWHENGWTIAFYKVAATWMGFLIQFLIAITIAWLLIGLSALAGRPANRPMVAGLLLAAAVVYGIYGIWNAFHPRVREISVALKHLPPAWNDARVVQISDIHLGNLHGVSFAERMVSQVNALAPDLVLITGDLFDGMGGPYESFIEPINRLRARKGVFFITGNHEHYIGINLARTLLEQMTLRVLDNEMIEIDGLQIVGVSYPGIGSPAEIANFPGPNRTAPRILMFHTPTNMQLKDGDRMDRHFSTYWMPDTSMELNQQLHADVQLSGHTHQGQIFPFNLVTRYLYRGYDYGLKRAGDLLVHTMSGTGSWGPPMRTGTRSEIVLIRLKPA